MISVNEAIKASQSFNRKCWLEHAGNELSAQIMNVAKTGVRELRVNFNDLIKGAENLEEASEMTSFMNSLLAKAGFNHVITPEGILYITW